MDKCNKKNRNTGFTLIEILVVIGILAIIASFAIFFSMENYRSSSYRDELNLLTSSMQHARAQAINNLCFGTTCIDGLPHGVHFYAKDSIDKDKFVIFQGTSFDPNDEINEVIKFDNKTVYVDSNSPIDIIFSRLNGDLALGSDESVILKDDMGNSWTIEVNSEGRIDWQKN